MPTPPTLSAQSILVIRRDNIGDLLCTTPAIASLRKAYPDAHIAVLANSYNAPAVVHNPHVNRVYAYTKAKHSDAGKLRAWLAEFSVYRQLRKARFDLIINANPVPHARTARLIRSMGARHRLGVIGDEHDRRCYNIPLTTDQVTGTHHVQRVHSLLRPLGIDHGPGSMVLVPPTEGRTAAQLAAYAGGRTLVGVHLSSRKPCNRWPAANYSRLLQRMVEAGLAPVVLWAPGSRNHPRHPGDDELARTLMQQQPQALTQATPSLADLIMTAAALDRVICPDGGMLHIAAALGKPTLALFGCTDPLTWGPWGVPNRVVTGDGSAEEISVDQVWDGLQALTADSGPASGNP